MQMCEFGACCIPCSNRHCRPRKDLMILNRSLHQRSSRVSAQKSVGAPGGGKAPKPKNANTQQAAKAKPPPPPPKSRSQPSPTKQQQQRSKGLMMKQGKDKAEVTPMAATTSSNKWEKDSQWRLHSVKVSAENDPGKDDYSIHEALLTAIAFRLGCDKSATSAMQKLIDQADEEKDLKGNRPITLIRKSFDARKGKPTVSKPGPSSLLEKNWVYVVDVSSELLDLLGCNPKVPRFFPTESWFEKVGRNPAPSSSSSTTPTTAPTSSTPPPRGTLQPGILPDPVIVVGSGPAGLFAALEIASQGIKVILLERGQGVEQRGRDIGALFVRGKLNPDSNLCYGEGGAGTWSDGKLTTRIGKNSDPVRHVLSTFVECGADPSILISGKPHLGTDRLVRMLKSFRAKLIRLGVEVRFGAAVDDLIIEGGRCKGVTLRSSEGGEGRGGGGGGETVKASAVVLAVGHSARSLYRKLWRSKEVALTAKPFALGFRIEHPQSLIDEIQYGAADAGAVKRGMGLLPVADYSLAVQVMEGKRELAMRSDGLLHPGIVDLSVPPSTESSLEQSPLSSSSSSLSAAAAAAAYDAQEAGGVADLGSDVYSKAAERGVYSFCMCPGGQIVPTSTDEKELCINGMSFSKRNSVWANSALVVSTDERDWSHLVDLHGPLAGVALQEEYERLGAQMGGFGFRAPVQRVQDFLSGSISNPSILPSSSYRLGVTSAPLHGLYSSSLSHALSEAMQRFERRMPGFISRGEGLLHGVETRTSAPVKIERDSKGCESTTLPGLFPCGEGAGYAGGIVSAAVDGLRVGAAVVAKLLVS